MAVENLHDCLDFKVPLMFLGLEGIADERSKEMEGPRENGQKFRPNTLFTRFLRVVIKGRSYERDSYEIASYVRI
jgi:hypothetical protein